jgi:hypothetical protein
VKRLNLRRDEGVAMTEFALILPVFLVIVAGLLGFGRVFFYWIDANHLANETARWAVVDRNPFFDTATCSTPPNGSANCKSLQQYARDSGGTLEFTDSDVCISLPDGQEVGDPLEVKVEKPFSFVPLLGIGDITIKGSATLRIERVTSTPTYDVSQNIGTCS